MYTIGYGPSCSLRTEDRHGVDASLATNYWDSKEDVENTVRNAGFGTFTILKPAFMMDNFIAPKAPIMFPHLPGGEILTAV